MKDVKKGMPFRSKKTGEEWVVRELDEENQVVVLQGVQYRVPLEVLQRDYESADKPKPTEKPE